MSRPSPALVIACLSLLVALGGTGYATVANVPRNSVGTLHLQRNAVKAAKIAPNAVRTGHVLNGSLLVEDFKAGQIPQGPKGDRGEPGPTEGVNAVDAVLSLTPPALTTQIGSQYFVSTFTTSRAGKLLLMKSVSARLDCQSWWWLTLDGAVVPGSVRLVINTGDAEPMTLVGVTERAVAAGEHGLSAGGMCFSGTPTSATYVPYSPGSVVVLG